MSEQGHTGQSLEQDKRKRNKIAGLVASGMGWNRAAVTAGVAPQTVRAYRAAHPEWVDQVTAKLESAQTTLLDKYMEAVEAGRVKAENMPIAFGIFRDKHAELTNTGPVSPDSQGLSVTDALAELRQLCQGKTVTVRIEPDSPTPTRQELPVIDCDNQSLTGGGGPGLSGQV